MRASGLLLGGPGARFRRGSANPQAKMSDTMVIGPKGHPSGKTCRMDAFSQLFFARVSSFSGEALMERECFLNGSDVKKENQN